MSRSNYSDACDGWELIRWRGAVQSAMRGARGQAALKELLAALDAMPEKALIANELEHEDAYCALGVLGKARGVSMMDLDPEESDEVAARFHLAPAMVKEIVFENDEGWYGSELPEQRWRRMRTWVESQILPPPQAHDE
jgi:hypothetical protein